MSNPVYYMYWGIISLKKLLRALLLAKYIHLNFIWLVIWVYNKTSMSKWINVIITHSMNISCGRGNPLSGAHVVNHYILLATSCAVVGTRHLSVLGLFLRASCLVLSWLGSPWFPVRIDWLMTFNSLDPCHLYILSCLSVT